LDQAAAVADAGAADVGTNDGFADRDVKPENIDGGGCELGAADLARQPDQSEALDALPPRASDLSPSPIDGYDDPAHCADGRRDADEGDVDCGGIDCWRCTYGRMCNSSADCFGSLTCAYDGAGIARCL
jgi:hypothetical protein